MLPSSASSPRTRKRLAAAGEKPSAASTSWRSKGSGASPAHPRGRSRARGRGSSAAVQAPARVLPAGVAAGTAGERPRQGERETGRQQTDGVALPGARAASRRRAAWRCSRHKAARRLRATAFPAAAGSVRGLGRSWRAEPSASTRGRARASDKSRLSLLSSSEFTIDKEKGGGVRSHRLLWGWLSGSPFPGSLDAP